MTDLNHKLTDMAVQMGQMQVSINEIKNLQVDVVNMLRKLDRVDSRLDHLYDVVGQHEKDLNEINKERISNKAKQEQTQWWLNNWRNIFFVLATVVAVSLSFNPQIISLLKVAL